MTKDTEPLWWLPEYLQKGDYLEAMPFINWLFISYMSFHKPKSIFYWLHYSTTSSQWHLCHIYNADLMAHMVATNVSLLDHRPLIKVSRSISSNKGTFLRPQNFDSNRLHGHQSHWPTSQPNGYHIYLTVHTRDPLLFLSPRAAMRKISTIKIISIW